MASTPTYFGLRYPQKEIGNSDDYLNITILEYQAPKLGSAFGRGASFALGTTEEALREKDIRDLANGGTTKSLENIILPIPQNLQDSNSADWVSGSMNPLQASLSSGGASAIEANNLIKSALGEAGTFFTDVGTEFATGVGQENLAAGAATLAANALLGQGGINQAISRATGQVFNQNTEFLFNGVQIRAPFNFSYDLVPRNQYESDVVKMIIRSFKKYMSPKSKLNGSQSRGLFISAPAIFRLEFRSGGKPHPFLHKFKPCALTQMNVNYNASGQYATYGDRTPVHMQLSLQFQELTPIYFEDQFDKTAPINQGVGY